MSVIHDKLKGFQLAGHGMNMQAIDKQGLQEKESLRMAASKIFSHNLYKSKQNTFRNEKKFPTLEEKAADEMEMAAQEDEEREKAEKAAQGNLNLYS